MQGLMMDYPLTLQYALQRVTRLFPRKEIVTQTDGEPHRYTYGDWGKRVAQLANALTQAGVQQGEPIAILNSILLSPVSGPSYILSTCGFLLSSSSISSTTPKIK